MKKYVVGLLLLIVHNVCAMEVALLSSEDDAKALRFAKLFNKYPHGYGENKECIDVTREKINWFLNEFDLLNVSIEPRFCRDANESGDNKERVDVNREKRNSFFRQFESLSSRVKQYQATLNNMEAVELLDAMHEPLSCNVKSQVYNIKLRIFAMALYEDAEQYYAISNAMKSVILEPFLAFASYYSGVMDMCSPCFLAELYEDGKPTISFSDDGFKCKLHRVDRSFVKAYSYPGYTGSTLGLKKPNGKPFASDLIAFVSQDSKKARVDAFIELFKSWVEYLANETNKEKYKDVFIELLKRLNWRDIEFSTAEDCQEILKRESTLHNIESWS